MPSVWSRGAIRKTLEKRKARLGFPSRAYFNTARRARAYCKRSLSDRYFLGGALYASKVCAQETEHDFVDIRNPDADGMPGAQDFVKLRLLTTLLHLLVE